ncbi:hypothetical protein [Seleniivibrio woodruffii]|uniref:hypothetical protein n=1 Tax=Seleniivibrio woodruffii TaxID=1078050 RepID=UPI00240983C5|nr:hypothetical protein [Seleniivibrio woodruffii]
MKQRITVVLPTRPYGQLTITEDRRVCSVCSGALPCAHEEPQRPATQTTQKTAVLDLRDYMTRPVTKLQTRSTRNA